jgi:hypothetical protein
MAQPRAFGVQAAGFCGPTKGFFVQQAGFWGPASGFFGSGQRVFEVRTAGLGPGGHGAAQISKIICQKITLRQGGSYDLGKSNFKNRIIK